MPKQNQFDRTWLAKNHPEKLKELFEDRKPAKPGIAITGEIKPERWDKAAYHFNITPLGKPRQTQSDKWKKRPAVMRYRAYADEMRRQAAQMGFEMNPNVLQAEFYLPMPESWSKIKKDLMRGNPHTSKPDLDNQIKGILDIFLKDDSVVHTVNAKKIWADSGKIIIW